MVEKTCWCLQLLWGEDGNKPTRLNQSQALATVRFEVAAPRIGAEGTCLGPKDSAFGPFCGACDGKNALLANLTEYGGYVWPPGYRPGETPALVEQASGE